MPSDGFEIATRLLHFSFFELFNVIHGFMVVVFSFGPFRAIHGCMVVTDFFEVSL